jgi:hypothetical protein
MGVLIFNLPEWVPAPYGNLLACCSDPVCGMKKPCLYVDRKLLVFCILQEVTGLTFQQSAEFFDIFPSQPLPFSELLERRLTEDVFSSDTVCVIAFFFECGKHINFEFHGHKKASFPIVLILLQELHEIKCKIQQVFALFFVQFVNCFARVFVL